MCTELLPWIKTVIVSNEAAANFACTTSEIYLTTEENMKKITGVKNPEPIAAEVSIPFEADLTNCRKILVLDRLQDPGNIGTLIRSAAAFGFDGIWFITPIVDPFNDKVLRSCKGAIFHTSYKMSDLDTFLRFIQTTNKALFCADLEGADLDTIKEQIKLPCAITLGRESQGIDSEIKQNASSIKIPYSQNVESLNVAVAGSIIMYELRDL